MNKLVSSICLLSLSAASGIALGQTKTTTKTQTTKTVTKTPAKTTKTVVKKEIKKTVTKTGQEAPAPAPGSSGRKDTIIKKKIVKHRHKTRRGATHEQETIEIDNSNGNTVVEINKGDVYVNGDLISTIDNPKTEYHKIIVRAKEEEVLSPRKPVELSQTKEDHLRRPMLGVYSDHNGDYEGAHVNSVIRNSPADEAGLLVGDIITKINGKSVKDAQDLVDIVNDHNGGETISITYERQGREFHTRADLTETTVFRRHETYRYTVPDLHGNRRFPTPFLHSYMFNNNDNTFEYAPQMGVRAQDAKNGRGVVLLEIKRNSPADIAGLHEGDIILRIDHQRTMSVEDVQDILNDTWPNQRITLEFKRDGVLMFAYMRFTKEKVKKEL